MKKYNIDEFLNIKGPDPEKPYRPEILTKEDGAKSLGAMFGLLVPDSKVPYHFHKKRESVIIVISGEGTEIIGKNKFKIAAGDIIFIPAGKKHMTINNTDKDLKYIEIFTNPPLNHDFVSVE
jgi:quercetin dioxygenase-like cupin family protein